jgi:glycosyltransferase involved in cell wall biosynthesis
MPSIQTPDNDRDGIPNVILEAFMLNVPVIASDVGGIPEAVIDWRSGLLVEPGNVLRLKEAILSLLKDHSLRSQIIKGAQEHCNMNFDAGGNIRKLYSLFDGAAV